MRRKPWARPELAACEFFVDIPSQNAGQWHTRFKKAEQPIHLELGCGKGMFAAYAALQNPSINYIGVDIKSEVLAVARRTIVKLFEDNNRTVDNILLTAQNIEQIEQMLTPNDQIDRIYINFCNPWTREKHKKRRLTHPKQLALYKTFLKSNGEIHFKTDSEELFEDSIDYFKASGFDVTYITRDLHKSDVVGNIETEHEKMFSDEGIAIKYLKAKPIEST
ncbi:tRNA (guanine-N(7)-)-methyltransferase [Clostridia bacterium]|nr:tRNA (guanine-N(7)-)-methyltransferase [Clostridia bacterium]